MTFHIYTRRDGEPACMAPDAGHPCRRLAAARFEAGDWAAAFVVAAAEPRPQLEDLVSCADGFVYLTRHWRRHGDLGRVLK